MGLIEFFYLRDCPYAARTRKNLRQVVQKLSTGEEAPVVMERIILNKAEAQKCRFLGSPSIRYEGRDLLTGQRPESDANPVIFGSRPGKSGYPVGVYSRKMILQKIQEISVLQIRR